MTLKKTTSETGTHSPVADILNTVSGAYCSEFWDGVYEVSGTLNTLRELKHSFEALYEVQKYKEAFTLLLALHDLIALEIPASVLEMQEYEEAIKIFMGEFLEDKEIAEIAEGLVRQFSGGSPPEMVDIDSIAAHLKLTVVYDSIAEEERDKIAFLSDGIYPLKVYRDAKATGVVFPKDTIVLDDFLLRPGEETHRRFSLAHEVGHKIIYLADPSQQTACFDTPYDCEKRYSLDELKERMTLNEAQANAMAAAILMPRFMIDAALQKYHRGKPIPIYGESILLPKTKAALVRVAQMLGVSHSALLIQLRKYKLLEQHDVTEYISGHLAKGGGIP